ncbi:HNH endonuclease family protein [Campylobacter majalis]|uniref:HNH endonuclease family protein n=1 Tax=Campylobacter majalis TaxID=2790656 RepID=UPI003D69039B
MCGYGGALNIRPKYQREYVYKDKERDAVINTCLWGFPLNTMYWVKNGENEYEVLDGQQRTISICDFVNGDFSLDKMAFKAEWASSVTAFHTMPNDKKEQFLDYELMIYICEGSDSEKLEWFKTINIAGVKLSDQELRNAVFTSQWLSDAKLKFSKRNCLAVQKGKEYIKGEELRQEILERALMWKVGSKDANDIEKYMTHQKQNNVKNADELWLYFSNVIDWVKAKFSKYRKEMKGLEWGFLYNKFKDLPLDAKELEERILTLMKDSEVGNKKGIYEYVLSGDEKHLNLRTFYDDIKREAYEKQGGVCPHCEQKFKIEQMQGDHILPWSKGGKTVRENCQMLCCECNRKKSNG